MSIRRIPPHSIEAEQSLIGSMLLDNTIIEECLGLTQGEAFYRPDHNEIYQAIQQLHERKHKVDLITVSNFLKQQGTLEQCGGTEYIGNLAMAVPTSVNYKSYCEIINDKAYKRETIKQATYILNHCYNDQDIGVIEDSVKELEKVEKKEDIEIERADITYDKVVDSIGQRACGNETGVTTGFLDVDEIWGNLYGGDYVILAARPSMGKTAFAINIATKISERNQGKVILFSVEMTKEQLVQRIIASEARVDATKLRDGMLEESDIDKLEMVEKETKEKIENIYLNDTSGVNPNYIRRVCRSFEDNIDVILIDYLQIMRAAEKCNDRQGEVASISGALKSIAKEFNCIVVALSQLSRACEARQDKRPMLSDLRESGTIEQDADIVAFLYRDEYYNPDTEFKNQAEVITAKNRNGKVGTNNLIFLKQYLQFVNLER